MTLNEKIRQTELDMVLTDVYWATVNGVNEDKIDAEKSFGLDPIHAHCLSVHYPRYD